MRDTTVAVSESEKEELERVAESLFGTTEVAHGAVISALTSRHLDGDDDTAA
jgi:hypothetical protein